MRIFLFLALVGTSYAADNEVAAKLILKMFGEDHDHMLATYNNYRADVENCHTTITDATTAMNAAKGNVDAAVDDFTAAKSTQEAAEESMFQISKEQDKANAAAARTAKQWEERSSHLSREIYEMGNMKKAIDDALAALQTEFSGATTLLQMPAAEASWKVVVNMATALGKTIPTNLLQAKDIGVDGKAAVFKIVKDMADKVSQDLGKLQTLFGQETNIRAGEEVSEGELADNLAQQMTDAKTSKTSAETDKSTARASMLQNHEATASNYNLIRKTQSVCEEQRMIYLETQKMMNSKLNSLGDAMVSLKTCNDRANSNMDFNGADATNSADGLSQEAKDFIANTGSLPADNCFGFLQVKSVMRKALMLHFKGPAIRGQMKKDIGLMQVDTSVSHEEPSFIQTAGDKNSRFIEDMINKYISAMETKNREEMEVMGSCMADLAKYRSRFEGKRNRVEKAASAMKSHRAASEEAYRLNQQNARNAAKVSDQMKRHDDAFTKTQKDTYEYLDQLLETKKALDDAIFNLPAGVADLKQMLKSMSKDMGHDAKVTNEDFTKYRTEFYDMRSQNLVRIFELKQVVETQKATFEREQAGFDEQSGIYANDMTDMNLALKQLVETKARCPNVPGGGASGKRAKRLMDEALERATDRAKSEWDQLDNAAKELDSTYVSPNNRPA